MAKEQVIGKQVEGIGCEEASRIGARQPDPCPLPPSPLLPSLRPCLRLAESRPEKEHTQHILPLPCAWSKPQSCSCPKLQGANYAESLAARSKLEERICQLPQLFLTAWGRCRAGAALGLPLPESDCSGSCGDQLCREPSLAGDCSSCMQVPASSIGSVLAKERGKGKEAAPSQSSLILSFKARIVTLPHPIPMLNGKKKCFLEIK